MEKINLTNAWGIYKILNIKNNKFYIGSSTNLRKRLYEHYRELTQGIHCNKHLQSSWIKYGKDGFKFQILKIIADTTNFTNKNLRDLETEYIIKTQCYTDSIGYNIIPGGIGTLNLHCSEEVRRKISKANKGKIAWNKGISMSKEQKEKLSESKIRSKGKFIDVYTIEGTFVETLNSISKVMEKYKVAKNTIIDQCKGRRCGKKWIFKYHNELIENTRSYIKNKTYDEKLFYIYNLNRELLIKVKYKKDVVFYLKNSSKRNGSIERKLEQCVKNNNPVCLYGNYIIEFKNALNNSNIINVSRQLSKDDTEGISNDANGEA